MCNWITFLYSIHYPISRRAILLVRRVLTTPARLIAKHSKEFSRRISMRPKDFKNPSYYTSCAASKM